MRQRIIPTILGGGILCYRFTFSPPLPNSYSFVGGASITTNLGIVWADAGDHTVALPSPPWDLTNGFLYVLANQGEFCQMQAVSSGLLELDVYLVDSAGVDITQVGNFVFPAPGQPFGGTLQVAAGAITPGRACGTRWEFVYLGFFDPTSEYDIVLPSTITLIGT